MHHPIQILKERLEELRTMIAEEYGREVTAQELHQIGYGLVGYFDLLAYLYHKQKENDI